MAGIIRLQTLVDVWIGQKKQKKKRLKAEMMMQRRETETLEVVCVSRTKRNRAKKDSTCPQHPRQLEVCNTLHNTKIGLWTEVSWSNCEKILKSSFGFYLWQLLTYASLRAACEASTTRFKSGLSNCSRKQNSTWKQEEVGLVICGKVGICLLKKKTHRHFLANRSLTHSLLWSHVSQNAGRDLELRAISHLTAHLIKLIDTHTRSTLTLKGRRQLSENHGLSSLSGISCQPPTWIIRLDFYDLASVFTRWVVVDGDFKQRVQTDNSTVLQPRHHSKISDLDWVVQTDHQSSGADFNFLEVRHNDGRRWERNEGRLESQRGIGRRRCCRRSYIFSQSLSSSKPGRAFLATLPHSKESCKMLSCDFGNFSLSFREPKNVALTSENLLGKNSYFIEASLQSPAGPVHGGICPLLIVLFKYTSSV